MMKYKKLVMIFAIFLVLAPFISAESNFDFDNVYNYDEETKTADIRNSVLGIPFLQLSPIATMRLTSEQNVKVIARDGLEKVAEIEIYNIDIYDNALKKLQFYDFDSMEEQKEREFVYKIKRKIGEKNVSDYEEACETQKNGTYHCYQKVVGSHMEDIYEWSDLNPENTMPKGNKTLGIFTDVKAGEKTEWIPTFFGVKVEEWASFEGYTRYEWLDIGENSNEACYNTVWNAQNFTIGTVGTNEDFVLEGVAVMIYIQNSPSLLNVSIYTEVDGEPGTILSQNATVDVSGMIETAYPGNFSNITMPAVTLSASTTYFLVLSGFEAGDFIRWSYDSGDGYAGGSYSNTADSGSTWSSIGAHDFMFEVWGSVPSTAIDIHSELNDPVNETTYYSNLTSASIFFHGNFSVEFGNFTNATLNVWHSNGSLFGNVTTIISDTANKSLVQNQSISGFIDGVNLTWNYFLCAKNDSATNNEECGYFVSNNTFHVDTANPDLTVTLDSPADDSSTTDTEINFGVSLTPEFSNSTNSTIYVFYENNTLFNQTTNQIDGASSNVSNWTISSFPIGTYNWSAEGCSVNDAGESVCKSSSANFTFNVNAFVETAQNYTNSTYETATETFEMNITYDSSTWGISGSLIYNGTTYAVSKTGSGDNALFSKTMIIPNVVADSVIGFVWQFELTDASGTTYSNSTWANQTVYNIGIDNCSVHNETLFNFTLRDEETKAELDTSSVRTVIEIDLTLSNPSDVDSNITYSDQFVNITNPQICIQNLTFGGVIDATVSYTADTYSTEYYYLTSYEVENVSSKLPKNIGLYDLLTADATSYLLTYQDCNYLREEGNIVEVWRRYVQDGNFLTVEMSKTNEDGQAVAHLVSEDIEYMFIVLKDGELQHTTDSFFALCIDTPCQININQECDIDDLADYVEEDDFSYTLTSTKSTRTIELVFTIPSGASSTTNMTVVTFDYLMNDTICSEQQVSAGGTLSCTIPQTLSNRTYYASIHKDGDFIVDTYFDLDTDPTEIVGVWGVILTAFLVLTFALMFVSTGWGVIIGAVLGFIVSGIMSLIAFNWTMVIWLCIAMAIIIYKISKKVGSG